MRIRINHAILLTLVSLNSFLSAEIIKDENKNRTSYIEKFDNDGQVEEIGAVKTLSGYGDYYAYYIIGDDIYEGLREQTGSAAAHTFNALAYKYQQQEEEKKVLREKDKANREQKKLEQAEWENFMVDQSQELPIKDGRYPSKATRTKGRHQ